MHCLTAGDGATMAYVAMFDEVDEGTAICKCAPQPPAGFVGLEGLPSDHYLRLPASAQRCCAAKS